mmetsp:Transcript_39231/g.47512  ORF Transcript_39231/g.47512 Transcript_39231/m.47512 type:complete len:218 (+) Transcript_39231:2275-2928(+)
MRDLNFTSCQELKRDLNIGKCAQLGIVRNHLNLQISRLAIINIVPMLHVIEPLRSTKLAQVNVKEHRETILVSLKIPLEESIWTQLGIVELGTVRVGVVLCVGGSGLQVAVIILSHGLRVSQIRIIERGQQLEHGIHTKALKVRGQSGDTLTLNLLKPRIVTLVKLVPRAVHQHSRNHLIVDTNQTLTSLIWNSFFISINIKPLVLRLQVTRKVSKL